MPQTNKESKSTVRGYDAEPIAEEIVDIFAKYEIPINFRTFVYEEVDRQLMTQIVTPSRRHFSKED